MGVIGTGDEVVYRGTLIGKVVHVLRSAVRSPTVPEFSHAQVDFGANTRPQIVPLEDLEPLTDEPD